MRTSSQSADIREYEIADGGFLLERSLDSVPTEFSRL
jgi:hypothetical protein